MPGESLFNALEPLLERVNKPIQYVGGELNSTVKDWHVGGHGPAGEELTTRWALMYPDAYEVGVPNQGVMILYEVLNERPDALAERTYAVWPDLEALMRSSGVPQFTVDAHRGVRDFDVFGVSFSTELGYTNMLTALDLAGIPLHAADRTDADPIVVARRSGRRRCGRPRATGCRPGRGRSACWCSRARSRRTPRTRRSRGPRGGRPR